MNWGKKILLIYLVFVTGIVFMVFKSSSQKIDLVTTDYYAKELVYQNKIDEMKRVDALSSPIEYLLYGNTITVNFPKDFIGKKLEGELFIYCPSDESKDVKKNFSLLDKPLQVTLPNASKGFYELHLSWHSNGVTYYFEKKIFI